MDNEAQGTINRRVAMHIRKTLSGWMTLAVFAVGGAMVAADPAFAKTDMDQLTIGGEVRIRYEIRNNTTLNSNNSNESAASHRVRVNVGYDLTPDVSFFAQLQDARIWGSEGNAGGVTSGIGAVSSANQGNTGVDLHQGYILLKNVLVPGLCVTLKAIPNWTVEPYLFLLKDSRTPTAAITQAQAPGQARSTVGGRINGKVAGLDATAEMAWQTGSISSAVAGAPANDVHINAWAGAFRAGYTMDAVPMRPRVGIEVDYASGDGCVANGTVGGNNAQCKAAGHFNTFENMFPTNHGKFGYMDLMAWKNQVTYQAVFDVKPSPVSKLQVNVALMRLANRHDNWYRAGQSVYGITSATNQSSSLGRELDVHYWHTFKEKFKFEIGAGHFWAGDYLRASNGNIINTQGAVAGSTPNGSGQSWGYVMGSILF